MAEFARFPAPVQRAVEDRLLPDEKVLFCFLAGSAALSPGDYVVITSERVLMLDERTLGPLGVSYVNVQWELPLNAILTIDLERRLRHWIFYQMSLKLQAGDRTYLIENVSYGEGKRAIVLLRQLCGTPHVGVC